MIRVFLDANVIFAASYSRTGASRALFQAALEIGLLTILGRRSETGFFVSNEDTKYQRLA